MAKGKSAQISAIDEVKKKIKTYKERLKKVEKKGWSEEVDALKAEIKGLESQVPS